MQNLKLQTPNSSLFRVLGMSCPSCARTLQTALTKKLNAETQVDFDSNLLRVDRAQLSLDHVRPTAERLGFFVNSIFESETAEVLREKHRKSLILRASLSAFFSMWILMLSLARYGLSFSNSEMSVQYIEYAIGILFIPILFYAAGPFYRMALIALRVKDYNIDSFISLEIIACVALSLLALTVGKETYFDTVAMSLTLLLFGKIIIFEMQRKRSLNFESLAQDLPRKVIKIENDGEKKEVKLHEVQRGDLIELSPHDFLAFDAQLISKDAEFDKAKFFGVSQSLSATQEDRVLAGYQLTSDFPIVLKVEAVEGEREIDRIYLSTQRALAKRGQDRSPSERFLDIFIRFTPGIAALGFFISYFVFGDWLQSLVVGLSLLIILCPCAFAFAPPIGFGILRSALFQKHIDIQSKRPLEYTHPQIILFDKNGTLTQPSLHLEKSLFFNEYVNNSEAALKIAATLESGIEHPISKAFGTIDTEGSPLLFRQHFENRGIEAKVKDVGDVLLGSEKFLRERGIHFDLQAGFVHMAVNQKLAASFRMEYKVTDATQKTLEDLQNDGYRLGVLTGDSSLEGLPENLFEKDLVKTSCTPKMKLEFLQELHKRNLSAMYVGDGVNDSLIMASSSLSFAVLHASKAAKAAAHINLLRPGIVDLPGALVLLRKSRSFLKSILVYALGYNLIAATFALFGFFNPGTALLAMATSSLLILLSLVIFYYLIQVPVKRPTDALI